MPDHGSVVEELTYQRYLSRNYSSRSGPATDSPSDAFARGFINGAVEIYNEVAGKL